MEGWIPERIHYCKEGGRMSSPLYRCRTGHRGIAGVCFIRWCSQVSGSDIEMQRNDRRMKNTYVGEMKKHFESYKRDRMGMDIPGTWIKNNKPYSHLLERVSLRLNIIETYRSEFWAEKKVGNLGDFNLHPCFHHLTSSQAMCFNLFFPFLNDGLRHMPMLLKALDLPMGDVAEAVFEKMMDAKEGTAFDFFLRDKDGCQVTFELKLTETDFGATKQDEKHEGKFRNIYAPMAEKILNPEFAEMKAFLKNYQFLRNLIYIGAARNSSCLFVLPKANPVFIGVEKRLDAALLPEFRSKARVVWLEDIVTTLAKLAQSSGDVRLLYHLEAFGEKYLAVK